MKLVVFVATKSIIQDNPTVADQEEEEEEEKNRAAEAEEEQ